MLQKKGFSYCLVEPAATFFFDKKPLISNGTNEDRKRPQRNPSMSKHGRFYNGYCSRHQVVRPTRQIATPKLNYNEHPNSRNVEFNAVFDLAKTAARTTAQMASFEALLALMDELEDICGVSLYLTEFVGNLRKWNQYKIICCVTGCPFRIGVFYRQVLGNDLKLKEVYEVNRAEWRVTHWHSKAPWTPSVRQEREFGNQY